MAKYVNKSGHSAKFEPLFSLLRRNIRLGIVQTIRLEFISKNAAGNVSIVLA